uniref:Uncharacterized protein n=1 Tax=Timema shepardi TaxID=629360 RepID=A0A7R9AQ38_TIMSH|nr:unnamed protein product [Timema shepardi]
MEILNMKSNTRRYQRSVYTFWMGVTFCMLLYGPDQHFQENIATTTTKFESLENRYNVKVHQAEADADITIINVALDKPKWDLHVVVGQDTDILRNAGDRDAGERMPGAGLRTSATSCLAQNGWGASGGVDVGTPVATLLIRL